MGRSTHLYKPENAPATPGGLPAEAVPFAGPVSTKTESISPRSFGERVRRLLRRAQVHTPAGSARDRELGAIAAIASSLTRAKDLETAARPLVEQVQSLLDVVFSAVTVVDPDSMQAAGVLARLGEVDADWWRELRLDLRDEPSGIASAVFDAAPVVIYDVSGSPHVSRILAQRTGAKSGLWVPILAEERVVGVLTAASTSRKRAFGSEEIALLQVLAAEVALALERFRSADGLAAALGREQAVAAIGRKLRAERSAEGLVRVATDELASALGLDHVVIDLSGSKARIDWQRAEPLSDGERFLVETVTSEIESALETARM